MMLVAVIAAVAALMVAASPAMAKDNGGHAVKEERGESPRLQAAEEGHFFTPGFFPQQCVGLCDFGFENEVENNGCFAFNCGFPVFTSFVDENCFCDDGFFRERSCDWHQTLDLNTNGWRWVC
jgi:exosome complex RNA-binding protein Rrp42 (RNase PH superfamily)